jgi:hypothetical protein
MTENKSNIGGMKQSDLLRQAGLPQTERWRFNQSSELRTTPTSPHLAYKSKVND